MTAPSSFDPAKAIELGRQLRRSCATSTSTTQIAGVVANVIGSLEPTWLAVRLYVTRGDELHAIAVRGPDPAADSGPVLEQLRSGANPALAITSDVLAFATAAWPGETVVFLGRAARPLEPKLGPAFEILALYTKLVWMEAPEAREAIGTAYDRARADVLATVLLSNERAAIDARRSADVELDAHNKDLRRTQRAMLNVIEDLREARAALASRVEDRTRELAAANEQLASRNRDLEEFVYIASHDLQEPLRTVAGYLQMIERRYASKLGPDGDEFIRFAIDGAHRMQALIESLLVYCRVTTKERAFEAFRLDEALDAALQNLALRVEETHATIERTPLPVVRADRIQMIQLFQNLVSNALKFAGGDAPRVWIAGDLDEGVCRLSVRDAGIGFNPKYVDRIFKVFRRLRRDTPGTGIGLAVCKKIVERHGGHIAVRSAPGEGATFTVQFPAGA